MTYQVADLGLTLPADVQAAAAANFARAGVIRIPDLFDRKLAEALHRHLDRDIVWCRAISQADKSWDLSPELIAAMDRGENSELVEAAYKTAADGFQFLFDSLMVSDDPRERRQRDLLLDRLIEALNLPASLETFRAITGVPEIRTVNGQATRYLPGHFLTSHDDGIEGLNRVAAYVINLSPNWRADWGGLLQFHSAGGDIPLALRPQFNAINLFRVPQMHSVSFVAPFAAQPRYSITGWLCR